jgi:hypothetical protein
MADSQNESRPAGRGLLIAAAPAVAYAAAYVFHWGYAAHFGIPLMLVRVDLQSIFTLGVALLVVYVLLGQIARLLPTRQGKAGLSMLYQWGAPVLALVWGAREFTTGLMPGWRIGITGIAGLVSMLLLLGWSHPLFDSTLGATWYERFEALQVRRHIPVRDNLLFRTFDALDPEGRYVRTFLLFMVFLPLLFLLGQSAAAFRTEFLVLASKPPRVVLARYGDLFVTAPLDTTTHRLAKGFVLIRVPTDSATSWQVEVLGRLSAP